MIRLQTTLGKEFSPIYLIAPVHIMTWLNQYHNYCEEILRHIKYTLPYVLQIYSPRMTGFESSLSRDILFYSLVPNRILCDDAEAPRQRTKSFIQALLRKNDLEKVGSCLNVTPFGIETIVVLQVAHDFVSTRVSVPDVFCASLQERLRLQLHSPVWLETGLFWRHHAV